MRLSPRNPGENARTYAHRIILDNIINLELPPGSAVSENELSATLHLSRTPVREALIEMNRIGLIKIVPQRGSFVTKIDYDLIEEAKFMRLSLETAVVKLACKDGISQQYLELLRENLAQQKSQIHVVESYHTMLELDNGFHRLLFESINKLRTYEFLKTPMVHFDRLRLLTYQQLKDTKNTQSFNDHENILYALEKRDAELAEMVMTLHLTRHQTDKSELIVHCPQFFV